MECIDRFELRRKLATGGMAEVYAATQWGDGPFVRPAVIKRMHAHLAENALSVADFGNEATLMARLAHPGVPQIFDYRQGADERWYLAMEYVPGPTLAAVLRESRRREEKVPLPIVAGIFRQLCAVLEHVHRFGDEGIIHGDLTFENVLLGRDGQLRLIDFGISGSAAYRAERREQDKGIRGTLGYIAPESIRGRGKVDHRADLYVVGVLLYELTVGERLFPGDGLAFMNAILEGEPTAPSSVDPEYPAFLEALVLSLLERDPEQRPEHAGVVAEALSPFEPVDAATLRAWVDGWLPPTKEEHIEAGTRPSFAPAASRRPPPPPLPPEATQSRVKAPAEAPFVELDALIDDIEMEERQTIAEPFSNLEVESKEGELSDAEREAVLADLDALLAPDFFGDEVPPSQTQTRARLQDEEDEGSRRSGSDL